MIINDKRGVEQEYTFDQLHQGEVYVDVFNQSYVLATDGGTVNLGTGYTKEKDDYHKGCVFIPVKARLEVE